VIYFYRHPITKAGEHLAVDYTVGVFSVMDHQGVLVVDQVRPIGIAQSKQQPGCASPEVLALHNESS
jgi:hypothetical protein